MQLIAVASAGRCEQAAEEPSPPALPALPAPGRGHVQASLETQPRDMGDGTVGRMGCLQRPLSYFFSERAIFNVSRAGEGPGRPWKAPEGQWGHPEPGQHCALPGRVPLVSLSPSCSCALPRPWVLPRGQHHDHVGRENCCYIKTANTSCLSLISPVCRQGRGCLYPVSRAGLSSVCPELS